MSSRSCRRISSPLLLSLHQKPRQRFKRLRLRPEAVKRGESRLHKRARLLQRLLNTEQGRIRGLLCCCVFARRLAQLFGGLRDVEYVIHNLKGQADRLSKRSQLADRFVIGPAIDSAADYTSSNKSRSLGTVNVFQCPEIGRGVLGFKVYHLAADHALDGARSMRD